MGFYLNKIYSLNMKFLLVLGFCILFHYTAAENKCVKGTNTVCTPFTYNDYEYDDCKFSYYHYTYWCLVDGQTGSGSDYSKCGECVQPITTTTTEKCVSGTNTVCTPFTYDNDECDECAYTWGTGYWCLTEGQTGSGSSYSYCGECVEPTTTEATTKKTTTTMKPTTTTTTTKRTTTTKKPTTTTKKPTTTTKKPTTTTTTTTEKTAEKTTTTMKPAITVDYEDYDDLNKEDPEDLDEYVGGT